MGGLTVFKIFDTKEEVAAEMLRVQEHPPFGLFMAWHHTNINEEGKIEVTVRWEN